jgi:hypothetical protein
MAMLGSYSKHGLLAVYDAHSTPRGLPFRVIRCHLKIMDTVATLPAALWVTPNGAATNSPRTLACAGLRALGSLHPLSGQWSFVSRRAEIRFADDKANLEYSALGCRKVANPTTRPSFDAIPVRRETRDD